MLVGLRASGRSTLSATLRCFIKLDMFWDNALWTSAEMSLKKPKSETLKDIAVLELKAQALGYERLTVIIPDARLFHVEEWPEALKVRLECPAYERQCRSKFWTASDTLPEFGLANYLHHFDMILDSGRDSAQTLAGKILLKLHSS